ncbi:bifunctional pyr operon transcriptional regulator/uracil phosphoribosyltransferase PyrR [bacterium]|nr:bifunctional pyr operon transcriptional regulator/uracil phosphoribosyltransferase PyrR [bacterium]RKZ25625.1 MAG: bifunctional pyr operon transcriptional regulator/uracil phosphoribosyltransferase PyrR [bacterium]
MTKILMDDKAVLRSLNKIAHQILEQNEGADNLSIIGIRTRGVDLANRIVNIIEDIEKVKILSGCVDITLYRDDFRETVDFPHPKGSEIQFDPKGKKIILVDDVLFTGRTVRSAIDVILDFGRPKSIQLAVLVDRDGRELPIQPDYIGRKVEVRDNEYVQVLTKETDGEDKIMLIKRK